MLVVVIVVIVPRWPFCYARIAPLCRDAGGNFTIYTDYSIQENLSLSRARTRTRYSYTSNPCSDRRERERGGLEGGGKGRGGRKREIRVRCGRSRLLPNNLCAESLLESHCLRIEFPRRIGFPFRGASFVVVAVTATSCRTALCRWVGTCLCSDQR